MSLQSKQRFALYGQNIPVELSISGEPTKVVFKAPSWLNPRTLNVLGLSNDTDLVPRDLPIVVMSKLVGAAQYILGDEDMNIYQGYIYVTQDKNKIEGVLVALKTSPDK